MRLVIWLLVLLAVAGLGYIRLAPSDVTQWHVPVEGDSDADFAGGALRAIEAGPDSLAQADAHMQALPRTKQLAGAVARGRVTYITRSRIFGFPDYTTLEYVDGKLKAFARLRFGQSDLGVNGKRLQRLFAALEG